jgi:hypothetical protein
MPDQPTSLATATDFKEFGSFSTLVRDLEDPIITKLLDRASRSIESDCDRRLLPFTITESSRADGIDSATSDTNGRPLDEIAALGQNEARAYGVSNLVRDIWLDQFAPLYPEMWQYSNISIELARAIGGNTTLTGSTLEGPEPDTGHLRVRLGTFMPAGTTVRVTYSGGYQTIPEDLNTATIFKAAKFAILAAEPQSRKGMTTADLDAAILDLISPFIRS